MKTIFSCLLSLLPLIMWGQITITNEDVPQIGDRFSFNVETNSGLDAGNSGPNQIWDFTGFSRTLIEQLLVLSPTAVDNNELFPDANISFSSPSGASFTFNQITDDGFFTLGTLVGGDAVEEDIIVSFDPARKELKYPLTYQDTFSSVSLSVLNLGELIPGSILELVQKEEAFNEVDGYGTMKLPNGDYEVLRLRRIAVNSDTTYLTTEGVRTVFSVGSNVDTTYEWLSVEAKGPLVTLDGSEDNITVTVLDLQSSSIGDSMSLQMVPVADFRNVNLGFGNYAFFDQSSNVPTAWQWDFGDGNTSSLQNPSHEYAAEGSYTVCLIASNEAGADTSCAVIAVEGLAPVASFTFTIEDEGTVDFQNNSIGQSNNYLWDFGDGNLSSEENPTHTYAAPGTYLVSLTAINTFGTDSVALQLVIQDFLPQASFTFTELELGAFQFQDQSTNAPMSWLWEFGDGETSNMANPVHQFTSAGAYTVCLTVGNQAGTDSVCQQITVADFTVVADFNFNQVEQGLYSFTDQSSNMPATHLWEFGDGNTSEEANPNHQYAQEGDYTVCLVVSNVFGMDSTCQVIQVRNLLPDPGFFISLGDNPGAISVTDTSGNSPVEWLWDFGDGTTSNLQSPSHQYTTEGTFDICLKASNSFGADSICQSISITNLFPIAAFGFEIVDGGNVQFADSSKNQITSWLWDFGDGNTATQQNTTHTYTQSNVYTACLTVSNDFAADSTCQSINVVLTSIENYYPGVELRVNPNPFQEQLQLELIGTLPTQTRLRAYIFDINGRLLKEENLLNQTLFATQDWAKGMYLLQIRNESGQSVGSYQLIKQ